MPENILLSLQITAIGMGLVFGAILLLWLVMALLVRWTSGKATAEANVAPEENAEALAAGLHRYSEHADQYVEDIRHLIRSNRLGRFDRLRLMPVDAYWMRTNVGIDVTLEKGTELKNIPDV